MRYALWIADPNALNGSVIQIYGSAIHLSREAMRADARKNYSHILGVAREAVSEHGADISMRDIARRSEVGLATLLRHFPTREALFEALLCTKLDALTHKAGELERSNAPGEALVIWCREWLVFAQSYRGVVAMMAAAHTNPDSALYASCAAVHSATARLLVRAQAGGAARADMNGDDLFALMTALGWAVDQPSFAPRADHLVRLVTSTILTNKSGG
ncbi:TetR/AcrR family transcriptional regulator [Agrobacterium sp. NPDC089420]|uniref:TetR/AcrR family transcriptional regulator n=1 Tax=Agrobacterium sp. NPDC089420 TaxID=3363918 RepID=UPI00384BCB42